MDGLVGVDIKRHQTGEPCPHPVLVRGNESVDAACNLARDRTQPPDVLIPSGGQFAYIVTKGRMVTKRTVEAVRQLMREQAHRRWGERVVQGKLAVVSRHIYTPVLDLRF